MPSTTVRAVIAAVLLLVGAAPAHAFRCGSRIITTGDHAEKILRYCGEPASVQVRVLRMPYVRDWRPYTGIIEEVVVEEWLFNRGPQQLMRSVRLENGFVAEIKSLGYGY
jgi:hypothetical protein